MSAKSNLVDKIIYAFVFFIVGLLTCGIFLHWNEMCKTFYQVKITDILQIFVTLVVGCFIALQISIKSSKTIKRNEIIFDYFNKMQEKITLIYNTADSYMRKPNKADADAVQNELKNLSVHIYLLEKIIKKNNCDNIGKLAGDIKKQYFKFKKIITGNDFKDFSTEYTNK